MQMDDLPGLLAAGTGGAFVWGAIQLGKALINAFASRKLTTANAHIQEVAATAALNGEALELVRQARDDARAAWGEAKSARQDADDARRDASEARREANEARREAMDMARDMRRIKSAILSPYATLEKLREMVQDPPSSNGSYIPARP
jgi:hypothetical protein